MKITAIQFGRQGQSGGRRTFIASTREESRFAVGTVPENSGGLPPLVGYAMTWNTLSDRRQEFDQEGKKVGKPYRVRLLPNSAQPDPNCPTLALADHDFRRILGGTANATLKMASDATGQRCEINPANTSYGRDIVELVRRGDVDGMSFALLDAGAEFKEVDNPDAPDEVIREYSKFFFDEVTVTGIPAFTSTSIGVAPGSDNADAPMSRQPAQDQNPGAGAPHRAELQRSLAEMDLDLVELD